MLAGEIVSLITIRMLLNEKDFIKTNTHDVLYDIEMQPLVKTII
jgi:hypothetical protein